MDWRDRVPACFGDQDIIFASHPTDEERAKKAIMEAKAQKYPVLLEYAKASFERIKQGLRHL